MKKRSTLRVTFLVFFILSLLAQCISSCTYAESVELSSEQRNAVAMLNYITVLTQDINDSKNSRLYMENAYSSLINNTYPNAVDSRTQSQLSGLLDMMEKYRMLDVKRERLQHIYEQNQAQAIRAAMPNPMGLLSSVYSSQPEKSGAALAAAIVYMAVDSATSYMSYKAETDLQYLKDGWALDEEEATALHDSRKGTFTYMLSMVRDKNLPGDLTLTENAVDEFVKWKNNDNVVARIQFLESNRKTYAAYGGYWLVLAESYYSQREYQKCIDAISAYENLGTRIFRYDFELAKLLPLAISAASEIYTDDVYIPLAERYAQMIMDNTSHSQWALRYFAAQTYVGIYGKTRSTDYLQKAYNIVLDNANYLIAEQKSMNASYLAPVQTVSKPKGATEEEKKEIDNYNNLLKNTRSKELPPVYEPLLLNCEMLFALAREIDIPEKEQKKIDDILHQNGNPLFLTAALDREYLFTKSDRQDDDIEYYGNYMIIPASEVTDDASIKVTIKEKGQTTVITDWKIDKVERKAEGDISKIYAIYNSDEALKYHWVPDLPITVTIMPKQDTTVSEEAFNFMAVGTKNEWFDYFMVWEGHRNNWYEYFMVWDNPVNFERVK